jgi:hypothetical protein
MIQESINYSKVIDLGFKRKDLDDNVFFNQYGFGWFIVTLKLKKGIKAEWDCNTRTVEIVNYEGHDVIGRMPVENLEHLKEIIEFFKGKKEANFENYA